MSCLVAPGRGLGPRPKSALEPRRSAPEPGLREHTQLSYYCQILNAAPLRCGAREWGAPSSAVKVTVAARPQSSDGQAGAVGRLGVAARRRRAPDAPRGPPRAGPGPQSLCRPRPRAARCRPGPGGSRRTHTVGLSGRSGRNRGLRLVPRPCMLPSTREDSAMPACGLRLTQDRLAARAWPRQAREALAARATGPDRTASDSSPSRHPPSRRPPSRLRRGRRPLLGGCDTGTGGDPVGTVRAGRGARSPAPAPPARPCQLLRRHRAPGATPSIGWCSASAAAFSAARGRRY